MSSRPIKNDEIRGGWMHWRHPRATFVGSSLGAAIVVATAGVVGVSAIAFAMTVGLGMVVGGWAGREFGRHRELTNVPREAVRRRRSIRMLRITRTLRRRKHRSSESRSGVPIITNADQVRRPA
jgi:hypothetical protein